MPVDLDDWLRGLGLEQYGKAFRDHDVDQDVLAHLTESDLIGLGVASIGHRRKLLAAIALLKPAPTTHLVSAPAAPPSAGERRQLTVMFCDIVGSTAIAARLDPEDFGGLLRAFQTACRDAVSGFGGSVAKFMGDGALVYFGYPEAHEDDAERAIRAGLALIEAMAAMSTPLRPQVRIGIATGLVVVGELIGEGSSQERVAVGETLNLAARLQAAAPADSVVVGELTHRLAGAAFDYEDLGRHELKGLSGTVRLWRVVGESGARGRFDSKAGKGLTRLVGRDEEIALLQRRWDQARSGEGQLVLLSAPPGFGKSRLAQAFREQLDSSSIADLQYFGSPFHVNSAFYPFIRQIERTAGIVRTDTPAHKLDKLEASLSGAAEVKSEAAPLTASLLSIPFGDRYPPLQINELVQKQRTMASIEEQLVLLSTRAPVLMLFEDAHWIDPTSLVLIGRLIRRAAELPVKIIVTYRPEFTPPWLELGHVTMVRLNSLGRSQATQLIQEAADGKTLPASIVEQIVAKSQGVPLFVEEVTRSILESGDLEEESDRYVLRGSIGKFSIPSTLQDSLIARLDRLGSAKEVALTASIVGREFSYELLEAVSGIPGETLLEGLDRLVQSDLLEQRGAPPHSRYIFKHALIRDAAFQSVLKTRKRELHLRVADAMASRFPELAETEPELLAHHYAEAGVNDRALLYWRKAGERASARLAFVEALGHVEEAMKIIVELPEGVERDEWQLIFLTIEGPSRMALEAWDSPSAKLLYEKARSVAEKLGRPAEVFRSVWGLWMGAHSSGQHLRAHELYQEIFELLKQTNEPEYLVQAHHAGGSQMVWEGKPRAAVGHFDQLLSNYHINVHGNLALLYGAHDPGCCAFSTRALALVMMGHLDQADAESAKAAELGEQLGHKPSIAQTLQFRTEYCLILNRWDDAAAAVETCRSLAQQFSLGNYLDYANLMQGYVRIALGEVEDGLRQAEAALKALKSIPSRRFHMPIRIGNVGRARAAAGDIQGALALFDEAIDEVPITGELWYEPELRRLKAEMLLAHTPPRFAEAEECLLAAVAVAQEQEARLWELRAATALAELWAGQGRGRQARDLLAPVHGWFTEGLDGPDVQRATKVLASLP